MPVSRRSVLQTIGGASLAAAAIRAGSSPSFGSAPSLGSAPSTASVTLPDKSNFLFEGTYLNAAYTHPLGKRAQDATQEYIRSRLADPARNWPLQNSRDEAVASFAKLINAEAREVAVVPSTLEGENLIGASLGLGPAAGVVTDPFHYDASLVMYGELHKKGMPLSVVAPRDNKIDYTDMERAISANTRLVAISLVSSDTGYTHDLGRLCEIAHRKGAMVYADVIQAAGAIPIDVKSTGVDFCCAGNYKYLMGEFGVAFLYVRADRLPDLRRVQVGWRQLKSFTRHFLPFDPPGPIGGTWELGSDLASRFEVSTPNWSALATAVGAIGYIQSIGVENIDRYRRPMLDHLQSELPKHGFAPLTPRDFQGSYVVFSYEGARERFQRRLEEAKIFVTLAKNKIRISPSVYNDHQEIDRVLRVLST
jgi:selenocysteine lyase/cysteine desulfurase